MASKNLIKSILEHKIIANQVNPKLKKRFVNIALKFINKAKINQNYNNEKLNQLKINLAVAFAHISLYFENKLLVFIPNFYLSSDEKYKNQDYYFYENFNFKEGVVIHENKSQEQLYSILCSTILKSYLHLSISTPYFSDNLLKLETEIAKSFSGVFENCKEKNFELEQNPIYRFAETCRLYFTKPNELKLKSPNLHTRIESFWKPDLTKYKNHQETRHNNNELNKQGLTSGGKLHFIYKLTLASIFISSFFTLLIFSHTLISVSQVLLLILLPAIIPYLYRNIFIKLKVPIIEIPFALFSIFGFGLNICLLLLSLNYFIENKNINKATYFFKNKESEIIATKNFYYNNNNYEFEAVLKFPCGIKKTLNFENSKDKNLNFIVTTRTGILGKEVIEKKLSF